MEIVVGIVLAILQLLVGLVVAYWAIIWAIRLFDRLFTQVNLLEEIRGGNVAAAALVAGIILAIIVVLESGVQGITAALVPGATITGMLLGLLAGVIQLAVGVVLAVLVVRLAIGLLDRALSGLALAEQIQERNVATAVVAAVTLVAFAFLIQAGVAGIARAIGVGL